MPLHDEKILESTKALLNIVPEDTSFDIEVKAHINSTFGTLHQLGVGPTEAFAIETGEETWGQFIGEQTTINSVKTLVYYEVRLAFDPPGTSFGITSFRTLADELKWRLTTVSEKGILVPEIPDPLEI